MPSRERPLPVPVPVPSVCVVCETWGQGVQEWEELATLLLQLLLHGVHMHACMHAAADMRMRRDLWPMDASGAGA
jgi:hypothetical protein